MRKGEAVTVVAILMQTEPVLVTLLGSAVFWTSVFKLLAAFGHPLSVQQSDAVTGLAVLLAGYLIRQSVVPASGATLPTGTLLQLPQCDAVAVGAGDPRTITDALKAPLATRKD